MTDTFEAEGIKLYCADCREMEIVAEAIISDPPYGIGFVKGSGGKGKHHRRNLDPIAGDDEPFQPERWLKFPIVALFGADHFAQRLPEGKWLVWDKLAGLPAFDSFSDVEIAWVNQKGASRIFPYLWKGICQAGDKEGGKMHVSQKPVPVMVWIMRESKVPVDALVCDPYMGSGTTGIACIRTGRKFIGIERDPVHFKTAVERIKRELDNPVFDFAKPKPVDTTSLLF